MEIVTKAVALYELWDRTKQYAGMCAAENRGWVQERCDELEQAFVETLGLAVLDAQAEVLELRDELAREVSARGEARSSSEEGTAAPEVEGGEAPRGEAPRVPAAARAPGPAPAVPVREKPVVKEAKAVRVPKLPR